MLTYAAVTTFEVELWVVANGRADAVDPGGLVAVVIGVVHPQHMETLQLMALNESAYGLAVAAVKVGVEAVSDESATDVNDFVAKDDDVDAVKVLDWARIPR